MRNIFKIFVINVSVMTIMELNKMLKAYRGLVIGSIVLLTLHYAWGSSEGMKSLVEEYMGDREIQEAGDLKIVIEEKGETNNSKKIIIIKRNGFRLFNRENKISYSYNSENVYVTDYLQTEYRYIAGNLKVQDVSENPAGAGEGWLTWFGDISIFPSFTVVEMEVKTEEKLEEKLIHIYFCCKSQMAGRQSRDM